MHTQTQSRRDESTIINLGKQVLPGQSGVFYNLFKSVVSNPFDYLLLDFNPIVPSCLKFRQNIFAAETVVYTSNGELSRSKQSTSSLPEYTVRVPEVD